MKSLIQQATADLKFENADLKAKLESLQSAAPSQEKTLSVVDLVQALDGLPEGMMIFSKLRRPAVKIRSHEEKTEEGWIERNFFNK